MFFKNKKEKHEEKFMDTLCQRLNQGFEEKLLVYEAKVQELAELTDEANRKTEELTKKLGQLQVQLNKHDMSIEDLLEELEQRSLDDDKLQICMDEHERSKRAFLDLFEAYQEQFFQARRFALKTDGQLEQQLALMEEKVSGFINKCGISVIGECGVSVNYDLHEVIEVRNVDNPCKNNLIAEVFRCGYIYNGQIMKKAQVAAYHISNDDCGADAD